MDMKNKFDYICGTNRFLLKNPDTSRRSPRRIFDKESARGDDTTIVFLHNFHFQKQERDTSQNHAGMTPFFRYLTFLVLCVRHLAGRITYSPFNYYNEKLSASSFNSSAFATIHLFWKKDLSLFSFFNNLSAPLPCFLLAVHKEFR